MSVGGNIKKKREELGISQVKLAEAVGVKQSMIAQIERGTKSPTLLLSVDIAKVLQCDLNDLVKEQRETCGYL